MRELCLPAVKAAEKTETEALASALKKLFETRWLDLSGDIAQAVSVVYSTKIHETAEKQKKEIDDEIRRLNNLNRFSESDFARIQKMLESWCSLTAPLRLPPGTERNNARVLGFAVRSLIVDFVNKAGTTTKRRTVTILKITGTGTATITYHSKRDSVDKALEFMQCLKQMFPEQTELLEKLREDRDQLKKINSDEDEMLRRSEMEAKQKYHCHGTR